MYQPRLTKEDMNIVFLQKSPDYPGGRIAFLTDGRGVIFPGIRFNPAIGKQYTCQVHFYEKRDETVIGIAFPKESLPEAEYVHNEQIIISVIFLRERGSNLVARHPITGAYIVPAETSEASITEGVSCWVMLVQRGTSLTAHFIKDDENEEKPPEPGSELAPFDPTFAAAVEQGLIEKRGMGKPPVFRFQGKQQFPWEILGIEREAEMGTIKKAYRNLSKKFHPDLNLEASHEDFVALAHAHDWMTFRRLWIDEVTAKTTGKVVKKKTKDPKIQDPKPPPADVPKEPVLPPDLEEVAKEEPPEGKPTPRRNAQNGKVAVVCDNDECDARNRIALKNAGQTHCKKCQTGILVLVET